MIREVDVDELVDELRPHFGLHPFPIVLESFKFNINYICEHGFRSFYTMTHGYIEQVEQLTRDGRQPFDNGDSNEHFPPFWLFKLVLNSIEVPTHSTSAASRSPTPNAPWKPSNRRADARSRRLPFEGGIAFQARTASSRGLPPPAPLNDPTSCVV